MSSELGTLYNGWSLSEDKLARAIEHTGQAIDTITETSQQLAAATQSSLGAYLKQCEQYSKVIDKVLRWRHKKHAEFESLSESLIDRQNKLEKLESSEHESQRLSAVLSAEGVSGTYVPPAGVQRSTGILATINSLIDNDPESTRRRTISKTKDKITTIEDQREACRHELLAANAAIQKDLDHFQEQKVADTRNAFLAFAIAQRDYHRKSLAAWQEAKGVIEKVDLSG